MKPSFFSKKIISWYSENKRSLPWRDTRDPYKIWLSEIILQQTRVAQGLPYYLRFVETFPSVNHLAVAAEQNVLRLWQGLGYYSRARNLHRCAKEIVDHHRGQFPRTFHELQSLPGIGQYTAAAIVSFAFREPVAVVDGNVFRVLSRVFGWYKDIASPEGKKFFFEKANELIAKDEPDQFNQAIMEFGATHCTPKNPKCDECVFAKHCVANINNLQSSLPVKSKKTKITQRYFYYLILHNKNKIAMRERATKDIWKGLYDFPLIEEKKKGKPEVVLAKSAWKKFSLSEIYGPVKHILSHQRLMISFLVIKPNKKRRSDLAPDEHPLKFYTETEVAHLPKPIVVTRFLEEYGFLR